MSLRLTCLLLAALSPSVALADEPLKYSFDDHLVDADDRSPHLELLRVRPRDARESLIRVREHFVPELYKSVEDL